MDVGLRMAAGMMLLHRYQQRNSHDPDRIRELLARLDRRENLTLEDLAFAIEVESITLHSEQRTTEPEEPAPRAGAVTRADVIGKALQVLALIDELQSGAEDLTRKWCEGRSPEFRRFFDLLPSQVTGVTVLALLEQRRSECEALLREVLPECFSG